MVTGIEKKVRQKHTVPRSTGRPPKIETARIRDKILDVAAVFFFTEGYGATSIEAIARRARISKRTIYHRFEDKPALFRAVVHRVIERLRPPGAEHLFEGQKIDKFCMGSQARFYAPRFPVKHWPCIALFLPKRRDFRNWR